MGPWRRRAKGTESSGPQSNKIEGGAQNGCCGLALEGAEAGVLTDVVPMRPLAVDKDR